MTYRLLPILIAVLFLHSCKNNAKEYVLKVKLHTLTVQDMFNKDLVSDMLFDAEEMNTDSLKTESKKIFLQAMDMYKNKKQPKAAAKLLITSILTFPESKSYYELGNAFLDMSKDSSASIEDAIKAYGVAEHLNFQPAANVYYQKACAYNMIYSRKQHDGNKNRFSLYDITDNLRKAFSSGFSDTAMLKSDPRINSFVSTLEYRQLILRWSAGNKQDSTNSMFAQFRKSFDMINGRFEIDPNHVEMKDYQESVNYDFAQFIPEMQNTSFGRDVSHEFFYVGKIAETPAYTALAYSSINFVGGEMQPVATTLVTYNPAGEIVSRKIIACQCSAEKIKTCVIENNVIEISDYKRTWEQPIDQVSFEHNRVKSNELIAKASFTIREDGKIMDKDVPANFNDSTLLVSIH